MAKRNLHERIFKKLEEQDVGSLEREHFDQSLSQDEYYRPRTDIYISGIRQGSSFIRRLRRHSGRKVTSIAIECQNSGSRKHRLGDVVNAAAATDMGFVICETEDLRRHCQRVLNYLQHFGILSKSKSPTIIVESEFYEAYLK